MNLIENVRRAKIRRDELKSNNWRSARAWQKDSTCRVEVLKKWSLKNFRGKRDGQNSRENSRIDRYVKNRTDRTILALADLKPILCRTLCSRNGLSSMLPLMKRHQCGLNK